MSSGGKYVYQDDQETPNTQYSSMDYGGKELVFEVRGVLTPPDGGLPVKGGNTVGNLFLGGDGWTGVVTDPAAAEGAPEKNQVARVFVLFFVMSQHIRD